MRFPALASICLILAACAPSDAAPADETDTAQKQDKGHDEEANADDGGSAIEPLPEIAEDDPRPSSSPSDTVALIPERFQGVWDYEGGTCNLASDLRMEVNGDQIIFYETVGIVTGVTLEDEDVNISLAMSGKGENWQQRTRLSLDGNGASQRLHSSDGSAAKRPDNTPSKRCAN